MNSFGNRFRVSLFGESHGVNIGVVIDGAPAGIELNEGDFIHDLKRRAAGAKGTTPRVESDTPHIVSGVYNGHTTGAPITILFENSNTRSSDYESLRATPRPGHADFTVGHKYGGFNDPRGGGHTSGRLTLGIVAAGVIAKKIIAPAKFEASVISVGGAKDWNELLSDAIERGDSLGGVIECVGKSIPVGLGSPIFDSVESLLSHILFAIPAVRGVEFGDGFGAAAMRGSEHNDPFISADGKTSKNGAGGVNGGVTNGNDIIFRVAIKPTSSISVIQESVNISTGNIESFAVPGRHDSCIALRVPVICEAAAAIVFANLINY